MYKLEQDVGGGGQRSAPLLCTLHTPVTRGGWDRGLGVLSSEWCILILPPHQRWFPRQLAIRYTSLCSRPVGRSQPPTTPPSLVAAYVRGSERLGLAARRAPVYGSQLLWLYAVYQWPGWAQYSAGGTTRATRRLPRPHPVTAVIHVLPYSGHGRPAAPPGQSELPEDGPAGEGRNEVC